ncbi:MAG: hypothetical protein M1833_000753 [Piccolia ochrophora]|nr:MAG: hypothetical protein M1833_000753 [Piccolia ochrophora]
MASLFGPSMGAWDYNMAWTTNNLKRNYLSDFPFTFSLLENHNTNYANLRADQTLDFELRGHQLGVVQLSGYISSCTALSVESRGRLGYDTRCDIYARLGPELDSFKFELPFAFYFQLTGDRARRMTITNYKCYTAWTKWLPDTSSCEGFNVYSGIP